MRLTDQQLTLARARAVDTPEERETAALVDEVRAARGAVYPRDAWDDDDGPVLWWRFPIEEPPYCGTPLDDDFPDYVTHWTELILPSDPGDTP